MTEPIVRSTPHVLLAEDEVAVAAIIQDFLIDAGYQVTRAADGIEALDVLSRGAFDLLLTDIRMPRLDGVGLIEQMRRAYPHMPVVVLSGYMTPAAQQALSLLGVPLGAVLDKPCALLILMEAIQTALSDASSFLSRKPSSPQDLYQDGHPVDCPLPV